MDIRQKLNDLNPEVKHDLADFLEGIIASIAEDEGEDTLTGLGARITLAYKKLSDKYSRASELAVVSQDIETRKELWAITKTCLEGLDAFLAKHGTEEVE